MLIITINLLYSIAPPAIQFVKPVMVLPQQIVLLVNLLRFFRVQIALQPHLPDFIAELIPLLRLEKLYISAPRVMHLAKLAITALIVVVPVAIPEHI